MRPDGLNKGSGGGLSKAAAWLLLLALLVAGAEGCRCRPETPAEQTARLAAEEAQRLEQEERRREEELRTAPIVLPPPVVQPGTFAAPSLFVKPGHWSVVTQPAKANANDFDGSITHEVTDKAGSPLPVPQTPFYLTSRRPLVVAKESAKDIDAVVYVPPIGGPKRLRPVVRDRRTGDPTASTTPLRPLLDHQYHFVVLAKEPARYAFLDSLYSVTSPLPGRIDATPLKEEASTLDPQKNYRVVAIPAGDGSRSTPLPDDPFAWTSIAYLLWDEVDPESLRPAQREAMVDWINWGGQLLVSGPDSLDLLRGSFLEPLLAATGGGAREIDARRLEPLRVTWAADPRDATRLGAERAWSGVGLDLADGGRFLSGLEGLAAERRAGRGRVVVTGFQLAERELIGWRAGVENLYNAALLRRPPRVFLPSGEFVSVDGEGDRPVAAWTGMRSDAERFGADPLVNSGVRLFARDSRIAEEADKLRPKLIDEGGGTTGFGGPFQPQGAPQGAVAASGFYRVVPPATRGGVAAWNDASPVATAAHAALSESAGVTVPGVGFVVTRLLAYLLVLVPMNWGFFHALGRVEWAWLAAPLIALAGAAVVVRQAQLDIGFVRARTEVAVLETHADTPRGVLSRFTALYTSLSTTYDLEFDRQAVAAPFARLSGRDAPLLEGMHEVAFERQEKTRLSGLGVSSATTEYVRSEETLDVSLAVPDGSSRVGAIRLGRALGGAPRVENTTAWPLTDVAVVRRADGTGDDAFLEGCWIGDLPAGGVASLVYLPLTPSGDATLFAEERRTAATLRDAPEGDPLDLERLYRIALDPLRYEPGESRIVGRVDGILPGLTITPAASQRRGATLVVAHLGYGPLPPPKSDSNAPSNPLNK